MSRVQRNEILGSPGPQAGPSRPPYDPMTPPISVAKVRLHATQKENKGPEAVQRPKGGVKAPKGKHSKNPGGGSYGW